jgi:hypothetical protein
MPDPDRSARGGLNEDPPFGVSRSRNRLILNAEPNHDAIAMNRIRNSDPILPVDQNLTPEIESGEAKTFLPETLHRSIQGESFGKPALLDSGLAKIPGCSARTPIKRECTRFGLRKKSPYLPIRGEPALTPQIPGPHQGRQKRRKIISTPPRNLHYRLKILSAFR